MLLPHQYIVQSGWQIVIPHEDKVDIIIYPKQHVIQRGWQILNPNENKVDAIAPANILCRGGGKF